MFLIPLFTASSAHKFYVSITKIEYVAEKNSLQIITKIFTDDMEAALGQRKGSDISLGTKKETAADRETLKNYMLQNIKISINGKPVVLKYLGQEFEMDMVVSYLEISDIENLKSIKIENKVLMDVFPEQQNIVHLKTRDSRKSLILEKDRSSGLLNFDQLPEPERK